MANPAFEAEVAANIAGLKADTAARALSDRWMIETACHKYTYNFSWLGRPIIQLPADIMAIQEIIWKVQPDLIIETGIAHGGSLIFSASILQLIGGKGAVVGIDIDIREHNRVEIEKHPMTKRITMIQGSSIDEAIVSQVGSMAANCDSVMVMLDSNHTHDHVLRELQFYAPLVTKGSYCVVFDTFIEHMPEGSFPDRPWDKGNNPKTAVKEYLTACDRFMIDSDLDAKLQITVAPGGYLKCIKD